MRKPASMLMAVALLAAIALASHVASDAEAGIATFAAAGDVIALPLEGRAGDPARGLTVIRDRRTGNCLICHRLALNDEPFQGDIGPSLDGVGRRLTAAQIRLRVIDASRINPATRMPSYYRIDGLVNVAPEYSGLPVLDAQQIEDIVAYLASLKE